MDYVLILKLYSYVFLSFLNVSLNSWQGLKSQP